MSDCYFFGYSHSGASLPCINGESVQCEFFFFFIDLIVFFNDLTTQCCHLALICSFIMGQSYFSPCCGLKILRM